MQSSRRVAVFLFAATAVACTRGGDGTLDPIDPPPDGDGGAALADTGTPPPPPPPPPIDPPLHCSEGAEQVYLLGFDLSTSVLKRFDPSRLATEDLGPLSGCPEGTGVSGRNPWGATLGRDGLVWAHYYEWDSTSSSVVYDRMFEIDPFTGACADQGVGLVHPMGKIFEYGLAFVRDPDDPDTDQLFASALQHPVFTIGAELHRVDGTTFAPTMVGPLVNTVHSYLTGTGDGRLLSMVRDDMGVGLVELDPATGAQGARLALTGLPNSQGPFAFWGGFVWAFWMARYEATELRTDVYKISLETGLATLETSLPFIVTASAVSTCAPIELI